MLKYHSIESFWTHEWPWIRFVLFLQWCMFKCLYCHNPDTISMNWWKKISSDDVISKVLDMKGYFWKKWWFSVSGGEPMIQAKLLINLFQKLKKNKIHTAIDTNWFIWNDDVKSLIDITDLFLIDMKHIKDCFHKKITWQSNENTLTFINYLNKINKPVWIRYVLVPGYTDQEEYIKELWEKLRQYKNIERLEILPYHRLGEHKRKELGWEYELKGVEPPSTEKINNTKMILEKYFDKVFIR